MIEKDLHHLDMDIMRQRFCREWADKNHLENIVKKLLPDIHPQFVEASAKRRKHFDGIICDMIKTYRVKHPVVE